MFYYFPTLIEYFSLYNLLKITNNNLKEVFMDEDETKYGEFISSYFAWMTLDEQKQIVKKLEEITKK